jgi:hydroxyethylthiazole kinase-like uncharacterized protein yjeF
MIEVRDVAAVRAAEEVAFGTLPEGTLMQRAAHALAISCARLLGDRNGGVVGSRVVLLVGSGNNGGDALWAGAGLAGRGVRVDALCLSDTVHVEGAEALRRAGGRLHRWSSSEPMHAELVASADLVVDGILGIGGRGGLRAEAIDAVTSITDALVVAVDVPSGVDADTGRVDGVAVIADVTVTFGAVKPGLILSPGCEHSGFVQFVDIGLDFDGDAVAAVLDADDVALWVPGPRDGDHKYSRGVVGVTAGSSSYPGAALLVTAAARHADVGMARYLDRGDGNARMVVEQYPDVVVDGAPPAEQRRATAWACGSGFPGDQVDALTVEAVLAADVPVVLDAGALTIVAAEADVRRRIVERAAAGLVTVLTPHDGEFARLAPGVLDAAPSRLVAAQQCAAALQAVVVLKGPGTVVADPGGEAFIDIEGTADLATAGSGDVLAGLMGGLLASAWAAHERDPSALLEAVASAVWLHGRAGRLAAAGGPVTAIDIAAAVRPAISAVRAEGAS